MANINITVSGHGKKSISVNSDELKAHGITGQRLAYCLNRSARDTQFAANLHIMFNRGDYAFRSWLNAEMVAHP